MKKNKNENSCYKEVATLNEKGEVVTKFAYDPNDYRIQNAGYSSVNVNINGTGADTLKSNIPEITTTSYPEFELRTTTGTPFQLFEATMPYGFADYDSALVTKVSDDKKEITRSEQMAIARMNTLKEMLDAFDMCKNFEDVYKVIAKYKREYDKLSGEDGK